MIFKNDKEIRIKRQETFDKVKSLDIWEKMKVVYCDQQYIINKDNGLEYSVQNISILNNDPIWVCDPLGVMEYIYGKSIMNSVAAVEMKMSPQKLMRELKNLNAEQCMKMEYCGIVYDICKDITDGEYFVEHWSDNDKWFGKWIETEELVITFIFGEYVEGCAGINND